MSHTIVRFDCTSNYLIVRFDCTGNYHFDGSDLLSTTGSFGTSFPLLNIFTANPFFAEANNNSLLIHSGGVI
jgi:hypothetical protein